jgi:CubicO group peptidase (beta-lactamase class C family)
MVGGVPFTDLDAWLSERVRTAEFSGVVLICRDTGRNTETLFSGAYGPASRRWPAPVTLATRFDTASVTKLFTSVAALQLVDEGRLDLDAPITGLVDLAGTTISDRVTVRQLLTHTSGIADDADEEAGEDYAALFVDRPCYAVMQTRDLVQGFAHKPPMFEPGNGCRYNNAGFVLVGLAIEAITGTSYRDHVRSAVFARAGMASSGFFDRRDADPDVAEGWDRVDGVWRQNIFSYPPIGSPDGGAHVTAADLVAFSQALRAGRLLSPERTELFLTPQALHHERGDYRVWFGFGLVFVIGNADGAVLNYYKEGINAGASAILRHYPGERLDVVVLSNSEDGAWEPILEIQRRLQAVNPALGTI